MCEIMKEGKKVGTFTLENGLIKDLESKNPQVLALWENGAVASQGKFIPETGAFATLAAVVKADHPDFAFSFLNTLETLGFQVRFDKEHHT